jgi:hypothetical protein
MPGFIRRFERARIYPCQSPTQKCPGFSRRSLVSGHNFTAHCIVGVTDASRKGTTSVVPQTPNTQKPCHPERHKSHVILSDPERSRRGVEGPAVALAFAFRATAAEPAGLFFCSLFPIPCSLFPASTPRSIARAYAIAYPRTLHTRKGHHKPTSCYEFVPPSVPPITCSLKYARASSAIVSNQAHLTSRD